MANTKISELSNAGALNGTEVLPIVQGNATVKTTTQNIANLLGINYTPENVANKDTDATLSSNSDIKYPSQKAVKSYVDSAVVSAIKDNGNWDASGNLFPNVNSQGQSITKGDLWYISVAGTLGGTSVLTGYSIRALVDNPAQNAANWGILNVGLGFVPENVANKSTDGTLSANSDTLYPSQKAVRTYVNSISAPIPTLAQVTSAGATTTSAIIADEYSTASGARLRASGRLIAKDIVLQPTIGSSANQLTFDSSLITGSKTYTLPNATGTIALLSSLSATSPISYNSGTGVISMPQASGSQNGFLSSSDWTTFNNKLSTATAASTYLTIANAATTYLPLAGGTMFGALNMGYSQLNFNGYSFENSGGGLMFMNSSTDKIFLNIESTAANNINFPAADGIILLSVNTSSGSLTTTSTGSVTIPDANATTVGLVNTSSQTFAGSKVFNGGVTSVGNIRGMAAIIVQPSGGNTLTELTYSGTPGTSGIGVIRLHKESGGYAQGVNITPDGTSYFNGGSVGIGASSPNGSAKLQIDSTTQGFLPPRMTQAQRVAITSPADGLIVYQTDGGAGVNGIWVYDNTGTTWRRLNWT